MGPQTRWKRNVEVKISLTSAEVCLPTPEARMEGCSSRGRCDVASSLSPRCWKLSQSHHLSTGSKWSICISILIYFDYCRAMFQFVLRILFTWLGAEKKLPTTQHVYTYSLYLGTAFKRTFWDMSLFTPCFLISPWPTWSTWFQIY